MNLEWDGDRAVANGVVYALGSEDLLGRHGGRIWYVYVYEKPGQRATDVLSTERGDKRSARRAAERHANR